MERKKWVMTGITLGVVAALLVVPPIALGTSQYPVVIVSGISMLPTLHSGCLVGIKGIPPNTMIPNGTIIAYSPQQLGIPLVDSFTAPIIIHRIVRVYDINGVVSYTTKGDNNRVVDSPNVSPDQILGEKLFVIPYVGMAVLFVAAPQGLVVVVALIAFTYLVEYENKFSVNKARQMVIRYLTTALIEDKITGTEYTKLKALIENPPIDNNTPALDNWLQKHADADIEMKIEIDPKCGGTRLQIRSVSPNDKSPAIFVCVKHALIKTWSEDKAVKDGSNPQNNADKSV
jgi:signal peptidase